MSIKKIIAVIALTISIVPILRSQNLDDVKQLIENERYNSAELLLENNMGNAEPEVNYLLVKTYLEQEKTDEAANFVNKYLQSALGIDVDPLNRVAAARFLMNAGNKMAAEEIFTSVLNTKKSQKNPSLLLAMAEVYIEEKDGDARIALTWLDMAKKGDKHNPDIDIARGLAYRKLKDATNAYLAYKDAIEIDPKNARAYYLMGKIFTAQKNPEIYLQNFMKAYEIDSTYAPVLEELYNHYYFRDVRTAKKYLEKYIANTDYSLQNDYFMTDILYLNGEYQNAIQSANSIISKERTKAQPRLYKLMAYSYAKLGDSTKALEHINDYLSKEAPAKIIAPDYQLIAQLMEVLPGQEEGAIAYYSIAADKDTITTNKAEYAAAIAELYKKTGNNAKQAEWLGKVYGWKEKSNNVDLFNWGLAFYKAANYRASDSVFIIYTDRYPEDIYGYYWRAQANASIDTSMANSLAIPYYRKVVEIGEKNKEANKNMLLKAYGYLGGYEANITKDYKVSLEWFEKYLAIEQNADVAKYVEILTNWIWKEKE